MQMSEDGELVERVADALKRKMVEVGSRFGSSREAIEILARAAIAEVQRWRPIEEAPRDGTPIIAWDAPMRGEAYFETGDKQWWWTNTGPGEYTGRCIFPTQWQPLPAPPQ